MDEKKPYPINEPTFSNLPDENLAWEKMKARLDEEEGRRRFVLPPFLTGCGGWALLLLLLAGGFGLYMAFYNPDEKESTTTQVNQQDSIQETGTTATSGTKGRVKREMQNGDENSIRLIETDIKDKKEKPITTEENVLPKSTVIAEKTIEDNIRKKNYDKKNQTAVKQTTNKKTSSIAKGKTDVLKNRNVETYINENSAAPEKKQLENNVENTIAEVSDSNSLSKDNSVAIDDSSVVIKDSSLNKTSSVDSTQTEKNKKQNKGWVVAAGLTVQQQLPFGGQQWTPYNYMGRKGSLADYVPAVYIRLYKGEKWFLQSGFRYGAPQYSKEFVYTQNYKLDTIGQVQSTTAYRLKKTYYHQLPFSFHYFVKPGWSVGIGGVYNKFFGAVSEKEERERLTATTDTLISKTLVRDRNDSLFRSHNFQLLLETQYRWKRFSIGAQYTPGLQPFIEYTNALGQKQKQRNFAVNVFVRYELWQSKKQ